jgi:DNA-binding CsgD family transcriptional regulator
MLARAAADRIGSVQSEDLDRLATDAYLAGDDAASAALRARAHAAHLERGDLVAAARSAYWLGFALQDRPARRAQAGGWMARARRLLDESGQDCVEVGFLLCAQGFELATSGQPRDALSAFEQGVAVGTRFRDPTLLALARHGVARCLIRLNRAHEGFALLDEVMVGVTGGEVMPMIAGTVYCSVISACHDAFDLRRAQEWTAALDAWCAARPDLVPFRGTCLVRRAELLQIHGDWPQATTEVARAAALCERLESSPDVGAACYQQGELHRLQGRYAAADECYRRAALAGRKPYPGLALLRLAEGQLEAAETAVRTMLAELRDPRARARVLGAAVDVLIARRDLAGARAAADALARTAAEIDAPILHAGAAQAAGALALASGDAAGALPAFREALAVWVDVGAPYEVATLRAQLGLAYRAIGDAEGARLEIEAAQEGFERLGAVADAARVAPLVDTAGPPASGPLTGREVEVLRLVATGATNRAIASELAISEKTVARHLSNIFTKLDLPSRAAATAYAYEHKLM